MILVDLNLLIYATNRDSPRHERARTWLEETLSSEETVALSWSVLLGFLRISTRPGAFTNPLTFEKALEVVDAWLACPCVTLLNPGELHWSQLKALLEQSGAAGNLTTDAHLAALALEFDATLCSTDHDFLRFGRKLRFFNPLS